MTTIRKVLIQSQAAPTAQTTLYTATGVTAVIDKMTATNTSVGALTITVNLVPAVDVPGTGNIITQNVSIAAGESYLFPEIVGHDLAVGDRISVIAGGTALTLRASGREFTSG